ncbi:MAG: histidinol dehydrogenase [Planctomycetes bacterium HGW-Planctomycetes-1]|nr:MAG: histidinol dehydrogenase [Planctomycetes bacterium HGW-Planctomycetes-1]
MKKILLSYTSKNFEQKLSDLRKKVSGKATFSPRSLEGEKVAKIIEDIWDNGDKAVAKYTNLFDKVKLSPRQFKVSPGELKKAHQKIDRKLLSSIRKAIANVKNYQKKIFIGTAKGVSVSTGIKYSPIKRVGICVPGASAPLPSTVIMTAVPAQVAGVKEIAVVSPPRYKGSIHPVILATCYELKINEVYRIGGVQAVAALANGTKIIQPVDMIVGPGNQWGQTAKRLVFGQVKIDSLAGPSEVLVIADDSAKAAWLAADMLSQAEHAPGSALLFTPSKKLAQKVVGELEKQAAKLGRGKETMQCLNQYSGVVIFKNIQQCIEWANLFATEHLQIQCGKKSKQIASKIENAGAIFIGDYSPVATGDYFAGPSHTLPTGGSARFSSALTSNDFVKSTSIIEYDKKRLSKDATDIIRLAEAEGLDAHAKSVKIRIEK